jgi:hypothetical protein
MKHARWLSGGVKRCAPRERSNVSRAATSSTVGTGLMPLATSPSRMARIAAVARWTLPQCGGQRDDRRSLAISRQMLIAGLIHGRIGRRPLDSRATDSQRDQSSVSGASRRRRRPAKFANFPNEIGGVWWPHFPELEPAGTLATAGRSAEVGFVRLRLGAAQSGAQIDIRSRDPTSNPNSGVSTLPIALRFIVKRYSPLSSARGREREPSEGATGWLTSPHC